MKCFFIVLNFRNSNIVVMIIILTMALINTLIASQVINSERKGLSEGNEVQLFSKYGQKSINRLANK